MECFTDLSTNDGLTKLENYLKERTQAYKTNERNLVPLKTPVSIKCASVGSLRGISSGDDVFDDSECTPRSGSDQRRDLTATPCSRTRNPNITNFRNRLNLDESPESNCERITMEYDPNLENMDGQEERVRDIQAQRDMDVGACHEQKTDKNYCNSPMKGQSPVSPGATDLSPEYSARSLNISSCSEDSLSGLIPEFRSLSLDDSSKSKEENNCATEVREFSPIENRCGGEIENTQKEDVSFFIEGVQPSKVDLDVFRTIKTTAIDPVVYPYIFRWQKMVRFFSKTTRQAWPSPGSPRYYRMRRGIKKTLSC